MANLIFDKAQIEATIDKIVDRTMRMDMTWDWPCGVAYYGICEAYEVIKNERYLQLVKDRVDEYIELGLPSWTVNTCSMGHCLITLYEHTGDEKYLDIAKSKVEYLEKEALRFGDHVLQHTVSVNNDFPEQAWADTLFMAGFFLLRMGVLLKDEEMCIRDRLWTLPTSRLTARRASPLSLSTRWTEPSASGNTLRTTPLPM